MIIKQSEITIIMLSSDISLNTKATAASSNGAIPKLPTYKTRIKYKKIAPCFNFEYLWQLVPCSNKLCWAIEQNFLGWTLHMNSSKEIITLDVHLTF